MIIKKRYITLLEIMIVVLLIGIISSVIGYNVKGSLNKGKAFKTQMAQKQIKDILYLSISEGKKIDDVTKNHKQYLKDSGLVKSIDNLLKDGWGEGFIIKNDKNNILVKSKKLEEYLKKHNKSIELEEDEEDY